MKLRTLVVGAVLVSAGPLAMAAENVGPYIGGNFGFASVDTGAEMQNTVNSIVALGYTSASMTMEQRSSGYKIFGGYQANENFAVEGYWANLGTYSYTLFTTGPTLSGSGDIKETAIGVDLVGMLPFDSTTSGFARVGVYQWEVKDSFSLSTGQSFSDSTSGSDIKFGLGAEWKVNPSIRLRTEWEYYNDKDTPVSVLSVGIASHF